MNRLAYTWHGVIFGSIGLYLFVIAVYNVSISRPLHLSSRCPISHYHFVARVELNQLGGRFVVALGDFVNVGFQVMSTRSLVWLLILFVPLVGMAVDIACKALANMFFPTQTQIHLEIEYLERKKRREERRRNKRPSPSLFLTLLLAATAAFATFIPSVHAAAGSSPPRTTIPRSTHNTHYDRLRQAATSKDKNTKSNGDGDDDDNDPNSLSINGDNFFVRPPWTPSPHIDRSGFCKTIYTRIAGEWEPEVYSQIKASRHANPLHLELVPVQIRQVPGDGNCLFHSITTCFAHANSTRLQYPRDLTWLYKHSAHLRQEAVDCLRQRRRVLFLQGHEYLRAQDLVQAAADQYGISPKEYCDLMQQDSYWGGGPEIVALCNVLKRPIHVYELANAKSTGHHKTPSLTSSSEGNSGNGEHHNTGFRRKLPFTTPSQDDEQPNREHKAMDTKFVLRRMACFGSPKFDKREPFHILTADSRFPDLTPGEQLPSGNHFLAIFPLPEHQAALKEYIKRQKRLAKQRKKQLRQGHKKHPKEYARGGTNADDENYYNNHKRHKSGSADEAMDYLVRDMERRARHYHQRQHQLMEMNHQRMGTSSVVKEYVFGLVKRIFWWAPSSRYDDENDDDAGDFDDRDVYSED